LPAAGADGRRQKTEAAAIPMLSRMLRQEWPAASVLYVCPIKALLNNLEQRLSHYAGLAGRRVEVWHGDISQSRKQRALKSAPDIHVASLENASTVIARLHRGQKRLVFCDSRSSAEQLSSMLRAHEVRTFLSHASLSASECRQAETAFAEEKDCVIVATSTLELGIDVGDLDKVIQIDAPSTVSSFLQRMGRTGRRPGSRRNCLFLATNDNAFLLALGIAQRWSEAWVEAAIPPAQPWPIVAQQAMVATLERRELPTHELAAVLSGSFPELVHAEIELLVEHMVDIEYLNRSEGIVRVGPRLEREFGRGHYRDLLASFSGSLLLTGKHGNAEVGYIDPTVLTGEQENRLILLAGRSWRVTGVEWARKTVWLEPAKEGGKARWMGGARSLSRDVCQGIRTVLTDGAPPLIALSQRAKTALQFLRDDLGMSPGTHFIATRSDDATVRTWTFAGTRANRTFARSAAGAGGKVKFDALSVQAPASLFAQVRASLVQCFVLFGT
jgi:ATP-dependent Lhr-like helicase